MALQTANLMAWTSRQLGASANLQQFDYHQHSTWLLYAGKSGVEALLKGRRPAAWPIALH